MKIAGPPKSMFRKMMVDKRVVLRLSSFRAASFDPWEIARARSVMWSRAIRALIRRCGPAFRAHYVMFGPL